MKLSPIVMFDPKIWALVPFHFWTLCFFVFGCLAGSFLKVCIHRMPREESIVRPASHCPHCGYSIPWYLNIPLVTWLWLRGRCANCRAPISARYFLVELLTGIMFAACWIHFGSLHLPLAALVYCAMIGGLIAATFIDFAHLNFPYFKPLRAVGPAMIDSLMGMAAGGAVIYGILRLGKLLFGRYRVNL